jgi:hypothetical protein
MWRSETGKSLTMIRFSGHSIGSMGGITRLSMLEMKLCLSIVTIVEEQRQSPFGT